MKKERIWELDALRGLCILGMIAVHFLYDLVTFTDATPLLPSWFSVVQEYGHLLFVLISGLCATLGTRSVKRGAVVLGAGLLVSYVTLFGEAVVGVAGLRIWFGILHLLGVCMLLYPLFRRLPWPILAALGVGFVALGLWMQTVTVSVTWLFPLGLRAANFYCGSDFFPLFPGLGWFLLGAVIGKTLYRDKRTRLPAVRADRAPLRFLRFCGRHSLAIYLLHQPVLVVLALLL